MCVWLQMGGNMNDPYVDMHRTAIILLVMMTHYQLVANKIPGIIKATACYAMHTNDHHFYLCVVLNRVYQENVNRSSQCIFVYIRCQLPLIACKSHCKRIHLHFSSIASNKPHITYEDLFVSEKKTLFIWMIVMCCCYWLHSTERKRNGI